MQWFVLVKGIKYRVEIIQRVVLIGFAKPLYRAVIVFLQINLYGVVN